MAYCQPRVLEVVGSNPIVPTTTTIHAARAGARSARRAGGSGRAAGRGAGSGARLPRYM